MGYKTELQSNNTDLQTILNKINALPEAGGGGGGVTNETCTVTIEGASSNYYPVNVAYTSVDSSGKAIGVNQTVSTSSVTVTCVQGSTLTVKYKSVLSVIASCTNASLLFATSPTGVYKLDDNATTALIKNSTSGGSID